MTFASRVKGAAFDAYLGGTGLRRSLQSARRALLRQPRVITFWHRVADPHSTLLAHALGPLLDLGEVTLEIRIVPPPAADADPEPALRAAHALSDARWLAERHGLVFPRDPVDPVEDRVRRANAVLLVDRPPRAQLDAIVALGAALFGDDPDALSEAVQRFGVVPGQAVRPALEENYASLRKAGHYQGGMLHYAGEWYWGLDRLSHLRARLADEGVIDAPPAAEVSGGTPPDDLEVFFSFRSPYSYLALEQLAEWPQKLTLRPVLPMVMRGFVVPRQKALYIARDAKREAERLGIPFGRLCDPLGVGTERALAVFHLAQRQDRGLEFARSCMRGIWSEAVDLTDDEGLACVAERAGLDRDAALAAEQQSEWRVVCEENRTALSEMGLWGVPCFRSADRVTWGQDRIPQILSWGA